MTFDNCEGYPLIFVQRQRCNDETDHLFTEVYKFFSPITKYKYIIRAEFHVEEVFAIKFYVQQHSKSDFKYNKITNKGDLGNILISCLKIVPVLLAKYPGSSFAFIASPSIDQLVDKVEPIFRNQRFITYTYIIAQKIGTETFQHISYESISAYMLLNRLSEHLHQKEEAIKYMFANTYPLLLDIL